MSKFVIVDINGKSCVINDEQWRKSIVTLRMADVSTPETLYVRLPKCKVTKIWVTLDGAVITANAVLTCYNIDQTMGSLTIDYTTSGAGVFIELIVPSGNADFDGVTQYLKIVGDGGSTNAVVGMITVEYLEKI